MKRRFQHDFLRRVALRFVESCGGLGFSEHIRDAVITNTIARTKVAVRVVVEGAPANTAGILRIGGKLVMDAGVTQRMLGQALHLVDGLSEPSILFHNNHDGTFTDTAVMA